VTLKDAAAELVAVVGQLDNRENQSLINLVVELLSATFKAGGKLMLAGNGGSAAESQHMAAEYTATLSCKNFRQGFPAIALTTDSSFLTAWSNDFGLVDIFSRQVETLGNAEDVLFAFSTSGNSPNILKAVDTAKRKGISVIGFGGNDGGGLLTVADHCFVVPSAQTARIQECHTLLGHTICALVEQAMGYDFTSDSCSPAQVS
jgi:D-sedoheptulose 7-phosphate isomerase